MPQDRAPLISLNLKAQLRQEHCVAGQATTEVHDSSDAFFYSQRTGEEIFSSNLLFSIINMIKVEINFEGQPILVIKSQPFSNNQIQTYATAGSIFQQLPWTFRIKTNKTYSLTEKLSF